MLNPHLHHTMINVAKAALAASVVLALAVAVLGREYNRLVIFGVALSFAAVPGLLVSGLIWLGVQVVFGSSSDPLIGGTSDIARDVAWYVVLSYVVFLALGVALTILGLLIERLGELVATSQDPARQRQYQS
ncbi:MAG TPA: hypothetical protein VIO16_08825 [Dehalococcoidia bacterium]